MSKKKRGVPESYDSDSSMGEYLLPDDGEAEYSSGKISLVVEKILGRKIIQNDQMVEGDDSTTELYFIKWKQMSYLHASWESKEDIERVDVGAKLKIKRFLASPQLPGIKGETFRQKVQVPEDVDEDEDAAEIDLDEIDYFNPEFTEIHRVVSCDDPTCCHSLARSSQEISAQFVFDNSNDDPVNDILYLVKWRGLTYSDCTWEKWGDIKSFAKEVFQFWKRQIPPPMNSFSVARPTLHEYQKLDKSPSFGETSVNPYENNLEDDTDSDDDIMMSGGDKDKDNSSSLQLRDYQLEGVNWLLWNWWHKRSCILADEMGLGKTIQSIAFLHQLRSMKSTSINGPFLVIAPLSLVSQWQSELATWSPNMNCVVFHGNAEARDIIVNNEFYYHESFTSKLVAQQLKRVNACKFNILLTTYEMAMKDIKLLSGIRWKVLIIDEAHKLKNATSKVFEHMVQIPRDHVVLLTGTPLQNKTEELWALMHFADSDRFSSQADFVHTFGDLKDAAHVAKLHGVLKPYLLRRIKEDVEKSLPPKEETIVEVALTSSQKQFYRAIYERNTMHLFKGTKSSNQPSLMNVMMELRKCCNHPYLVRGVEEKILSDVPEDMRNDPAVVMKKMVESAGKLILLDKLLPRLHEQGHKVLIFSQMVKILNILEDFLNYKGYSFERLDGGTKAADRNEAVSRFIKPSLNRFVMLLSTKAGGLGLNLTAADTIIIFDSDWNPHNDLQAQARAHRIGQTKPVMIYRLLTKKTYEMHMFHMASLKLGLDRAVLAHARNEQEEDNALATAGTSSTNAKVNFSSQEIDELLKKGAYDVFREDDSEQRAFMEEDIDMIMQRRAHKVVYDSNGAAKSASTLGGFSKASFVSFDEKEDVDINDPDFWVKAVGLKDAVMTDEELIALEEAQLLGRSRKRTQVFGVDPDELTDGKLVIKLSKSDGKKSSNASAGGIVHVKHTVQSAYGGSTEPKAIGVHTRDRIIRALSLYGFGRWERVQRESSAESRSVEDIEAFARSFILQCGLCCDTTCMKDDTAFVVDAIMSAHAAYDLVKTGQLEIPSVLLDERFVTKLKTGAAKKTLSRMDVLTRLYSVMQKTIEQFIAENPENILDDDNLFGRVDNTEAIIFSVPSPFITQYISLGTVRPSWTKLTQYWDLDCDRDLIFGCYKHGMGKYDVIFEDPELCISVKKANYYSRNRQLYSTQYSTQPIPSSNGDENMENNDETAVTITQEPLEQDIPKTSETSEIISLSGFVNNDVTEPKPKLVQINDDDQTIADILADKFPDYLTSKVLKSKLLLSDETTQCLIIVNCDRTSKYIGVFPQPGSSRWSAFYKSKYLEEIEENEKKIEKNKNLDKNLCYKYLGSSDSEITAARAYDIEARLQEGPGAMCNFISSDTLEENKNINLSHFQLPNKFPCHRSSKYRGVRAQNNKWTAQICFNGGVHHLGTFAFELDAAVAYDAKSREFNKLDDTLNFPSGVDEEVRFILQERGVYGVYYSREGVVEGVVEGGSAEAVCMRPAKVLQFGGRTSGRKKFIGDSGSGGTGSTSKLTVTVGEGAKGTVGEVAVDFQAANDGEVPDTRTINRLVAWLLTSDEAKPRMKRKYIRKVSSNALDSTVGSSTVSSSDDVFVQEAMKEINTLRYLYNGVEDRFIELVYRRDTQALKLCHDFIFEDPGSCTVGKYIGAEGGSEGELSEVEISRLFCALILFGAPLYELNSAEAVSPILWERMGIRVYAPVSSTSTAKAMELFDWTALSRRAGLSAYSTDVLKNIYLNSWLPFCAAMSSSPGIGSDSTVGIIPNPYKAVEEHHIATKGLCHLFLQRQQLLRVSQYFLTLGAENLFTYLRCPAGRNCVGMPVWWCPWIHDVAVLVGILKYGFLAMDDMRNDKDLPFCVEHLSKHIRSTFLYGTVSVVPAAGTVHELKSIEVAEAWFSYAMDCFPTRSVLEERISKILCDLTASLPLDHVLKVKGVSITCAHDEDNSVKRDAWIGPPMSLHRYLAETSKRRRLLLRKAHPELLQNTESITSQSEDKEELASTYTNN